MNLSELPLNQRTIGVDNGEIRVAATRVNSNTAVVIWEETKLNQEILRTRVDVFTGETILESYDKSFWKISIDGLPKSDSDLGKFIGKSLSLQANPSTRSLDITTLVHHYTNINTLSLILKYNAIRFNRLDRVDDISETQSFGDFNLAKYLFVSCWTDSALESIPQWYMYTNAMTGVRITFPKDLFNYRPLKSPANWNAVSEGEVLSPIPFDQLFTDTYIVLPNILSKAQFERKVKYVDDVAEIYKNAVDLKIDKTGQANLKISEVGNLAGYKQKVWEFQSELRFVLFILPSLPIPESGMSDEAYISELPNHMINSIIHDIGPKINYFDVEINPQVLDNIVVTMGPLSTEGDRLIVDSLIKQYTKNGSVKYSKLRGTIRNPIR